MRRFERYCCEDVSLIENYEKALADNFKGWVIHHRLETKCPIFKPTLKQLVQAGLYYKRPACELIFMKIEDHVSLHCKGKKRSDEHRRKLSEALKGRVISEEHRRKLSEANKGKHRSEEAKRKISEAKKGKHRSEETKRKISEAKKDKHWKLVDGKRVWY